MILLPILLHIFSIRHKNIQVGSGSTAFVINNLLDMHPDTIVRIKAPWIRIRKKYLRDPQHKKKFSKKGRDAFTNLPITSVFLSKRRLLKGAIILAGWSGSDIKLRNICTSSISNKIHTRKFKCLPYRHIQGYC
jgi:hypothetical protein